MDFCMTGHTLQEPVVLLVLVVVDHVLELSVDQVLPPPQLPVWVRSCLVLCQVITNRGGRHLTRVCLRGTGTTHTGRPHLAHHVQQISMTSQTPSHTRPFLTVLTFPPVQDPLLLAGLVTIARLMVGRISPPSVVGSCRHCKKEGVMPHLQQHPCICQIMENRKYLLRPPQPQRDLSS